MRFVLKMMAVSLALWADFAVAQTSFVFEDTDINEQFVSFRSPTGFRTEVRSRGLGDVTFNSDLTEAEFADFLAAGPFGEILGIDFSVDVTDSSGHVYSNQVTDARLVYYNDAFGGPTMTFWGRVDDFVGFGFEFRVTEQGQIIDSQWFINQAEIEDVAVGEEYRSFGNGPLTIGGGSSQDAPFGAGFLSLAAVFGLVGLLRRSK